MPLPADIARNLDSVRRRMTAAAHRAGRPLDALTLVAVSKTFGPDAVRAARACGQHAFGENRVQEALAKVAAVDDPGIEWHLIGHLQANKARKAVGAFRWIQSVDRLDLLARLDAAAGDQGVRPHILIQADLAGEVTKHGADQAALTDLAAAACEARHLDLRGLMLVPPIPETPESSRPWFRQVREVRDRLLAGGLPPERFAELSMGMSHDFEVAIEEGATIIRVGTAVFGSRPPTGV